MSIWDDLYIINEAKSAKELVAEMSQEISMKPKKPIEDKSKAKSSDEDLFADNDNEFGDPDLDSELTDAESTDGLNDTDGDGIFNAFDNDANGDGINDSEDKTRTIHLLTCINQLYDVATNFSEKISSLSNFPTESVNKLIRLLEFYREYKFDTASADDIEKTVRSAIKILKMMAEQYKRSVTKENKLNKY